jgi:hypothetical protein
MKRTLVQFDDETYRRLRQAAFRQERSMSSVVRELVARGLEPGGVRRKQARLRDFASVGAGRSKQGGLSPVSERHDEALAAARGK